MRKRASQILLLICLALALASCDKQEVFDGPTSFTEDFENITDADSLFTDDNSRWSSSQVTLPENEMETDTTLTHGGNQSLRIYAYKSGEKLSKCSIFKQNFAFWSGDVMRVSCWYYLPDTAPSGWLFLMDMEESVPVGAGPGTRLVLVDGVLRVEHKYLEPDYLQPTGAEVKFPAGQWVELVFESLLSQQKKGWVHVYQDGQLIVSKDKCRTLPRDFLYDQQGCIGRYNSVEVGATANSTEVPVILYIDDVKVEKVQ